MQGWKTFVHVLHGGLSGYLNKPESLQENNMAVEEQDLRNYFNAIRGAMDAYMKHHGLVEEQHLSKSFLEKLEKIAKEQDGDIIAATEGLPEKEKALAQFIVSVPALLGGALLGSFLKG